jgi:RNA polymerase sigma factor (sigma-70 family)
LSERPPRGASPPPTRLSLVAATRSDDREARRRAFDTLVAVYWRPLFQVARLELRQDREQAEDLVQGFFASAFEKDWLADYDADRARFRTYLRRLFERFAAKVHRGETALKRGGAATTRSLDFTAAEGELGRFEPAAAEQPDRFDREWLRNLLREAVERLRGELRASGHQRRLALFERCDLAGADRGEKPSYAALAAEFGLTEGQVTADLHAARQAFRRLALEVLGELTGSEEEFELEAKQWFGPRAKGRGLS